MSEAEQRASEEAQIRDARLMKAVREIGHEVQRIGKKYELSIGELQCAVVEQARILAGILIQFERRAAEAKKEEPKKESLIVLPDHINGG